MEIVTQAMVIDKDSKRGKDRNGFEVTWYNITLGEPKDVNGITVYDRQIIGVPEDVFNSCIVGKVNRFSGSFGGLKTKWWKFDKWLGVVK